MRQFLRRASIPWLLAIVLSSGFLGYATASQAKSPVAAVNTTNGIGLKGHDPVAYFITGKPTPGVDAYTAHWKGVTYRFASAENQERFTADPEQYLPQYGGYCAYAMSLNRIADIDPDRWAIVNGKLYLNNNFFSHGLWSLNKSGNITAADRNWAGYPKTGEGESVVAR
jgi:YHS domain-containing protein